jgi:hypothetical protein
VIDRRQVTLLPQAMQCPWCGEAVYVAFEETTGRLHLAEVASHAQGDLALRIAILDAPLELCRGIAMAAGSPVFVVQRYDPRLHRKRPRYESHFKRCPGSRELGERIFG